MQEKYINSAKTTIKKEIEGLKSLINFFDQSYSDAIDLILKCQGKVMVSGMGKSGHIARKIAATLASTGTPAFFIHPGEASHGDLGMIEKSDVVILLSNSGETKELKDIIYYCKRFSIPIIGVVRRSKSELTKTSNIALILPDTAEANQVNAPTTSTTMMLALGDAIAVSLLEARNFTNENFATFHPGGKLGSKFTKASDLMRTNQDLPLVNIQTKMSDVIIEISKKCLGCTGVIDKNSNLVGIITDGDLRRHILDDLLKTRAEDIMTKSPITINSKSLAVEAVAIMNEKSITSLFVLDDKKNISGIIHIHDCLKFGII